MDRRCHGWSGNVLGLDRLRPALKRRHMMKTFRHALLASTILAAITVLVPFKSALAMQSPVTTVKSTWDFDVRPDGTYSVAQHNEYLARTVAAATDVGKIEIYYDELTQDEPQVTEAYTLKADGTKLPVDGSAMYTQAAASNDDEISSGKEKVIVFPKVAAGDTVVYTYKQNIKTTMLPGLFTASEAYSRTTSYDDLNGSITAPKSMPLSIDAHDVNVQKEVQGDSIRYSWHYAAPDALAEDVSDVARSDRNPRVSFSSFASYDQLGRTYAEMIAPALAVTPKVQAFADKLTDGIADRRTQAEKIYQWVGENIRYVSVQLGVGGYMPHAAEAVLDNGYGDCKDHTVLLAALLKAKGIDSDIVAINAGNSYKVADAPSLDAFDHAINFLPEFNLYVDSTIGVAPFGALDFVEYGKPVLHAVTNGHALRRTPIVPAGEAAMLVKTTAKLDEAGNLTGETSTVGRGPFGVSLRDDAVYIAAKGDPDVGEGNKVTFDFDPPTQLGSEYKMVGRFTESKPESVTGDEFTIPAMTELPVVGDLLMGPLDKTKLKDSEPTACFTGTAVEEGSLELPAGKRVLKLPSDVTIADTHLRYTIRWNVNDHVVSFRQELVSVVDQPLCDGDVRKAAAKDLAKIRRADKEQFLTLADDGDGT